eukprot:TRINITY_DN10359_c1_g1_i1.p1 TRINITY_DN10359_c1_g1~~TRINITY_DN10359_c1_g1_i1.p1  ORF type:complete len:100 (+),score=6.01 TRINITY_DN10359_c1_g1_i1:63-362(+)
MRGLVSLLRGMSKKASISTWCWLRQQQSGFRIVGQGIFEEDTIVVMSPHRTLPPKEVSNLQNSLVKQGYKPHSGVLGSFKGGFASNPSEGGVCLRRFRP